jgi:hypothetical protein
MGWIDQIPAAAILPIDRLFRMITAIPLDARSRAVNVRKQRLEVGVPKIEFMRSRTRKLPDCLEEKTVTDPLYKSMTSFLVEAQIGEVEHTGKTYLGHLIAVYQLLERCNFSADVCRAGMFHSIYGTELFQGFKLPLERRPKIQELIGERAERLAYLNCAMGRSSFDAALALSSPPYPMRDRLTDEVVPLDRDDFDDLCRVHLYDWLEQVSRSRHGYGYRKSAYRRMAERLGPNALADYERIYADESMSNA